MIQIDRLPAFQDNYLWGLSEGNNAWVVDPGDGQVILDWLTNNDLSLQGILLTHHHADHIGGVQQLLQQYPMAEVVGSAQSLAGGSSPVADGDVIDLLSRQFQVLAVPGHTLDHVAYLSLDPTPILFCGDTLFLAGCGRMFEGTPEQFQASLARLQDLPPETLVHCAHEYTQANLEFAIRMLPGNQSVLDRLARVQEQRQIGVPTVPDRLEQEWHTNPYFRLDDPALMGVIQADANTPMSERFARVRAAKDNA